MLAGLLSYRGVTPSAYALPFPRLHPLDIVLRISQHSAQVTHSSEAKDLVPSVLVCFERCFFTIGCMMSSHPAWDYGPLAELGKYPSSCARLTPIVRNIDNSSFACTLFITQLPNRIQFAYYSLHPLPSYSALQGRIPSRSQIRF